MNDFGDDDLGRRMRGLDDIPPADLPGPDAARRRGEARTRHQAIGGTFGALAIAAVAGALVVGPPSFLTGPEPALPTPTESGTPAPTPTESAESTPLTAAALLAPEDIWDYGGTESIDWYQQDLDSAIFECVPDLDAVDARSRVLTGYTNSALEGDPNAWAVVVHEVVLVDPDMAGEVLADLWE